MATARFDRGAKCAFSTADDAYAPKAVISLLSFKVQNPTFDLVVLTSGLSVETAALCRQCDVTPVVMNLRSAFYREWDYPREC